MEIYSRMVFLLLKFKKVDRFVKLLTNLLTFRNSKEMYNFVNLSTDLSRYFVQVQRIIRVTHSVFKRQFDD